MTQYQIGCMAQMDGSAPTQPCLILRFHRGETNLCGESPRRKQQKGCSHEKLSSGSKKKTEELCEMMKKNHAMENAKLLQEYEEGMQRDLESEN